MGGWLAEWPRLNNLLTGILLYCDLLIAALEDRPRLQAR